MASAMKIIHLHELPRPYPRRAIPALVLRTATAAIFSTLAPLKLLGSMLVPGQRSALSARIDVECVPLVQAVIQGLTEEPALFADLALTGPALAEAQAEAEAAQRLWRCLSFYADLARDHFVALQAECAAASRAVVRTVQQEPLLTTSARARRLAVLGLAPQLLSERSHRVRRGMRAATAKARPTSGGAARPSQPRKPRERP